MKLYRAKVPVIAHETIKLLAEAGDIEVTNDNKAEAEADLIAIMDEYLRRDSELRASIKDMMARRNLPYSAYGQVRKQLAEENEHPLGDDVDRFLARQFVENLMISRFVDEVYTEDGPLYRKVMDVLREHDVNEQAIREEAAEKVKNVREGTVEYEIALNDAVREVKKRKGLIG